MKTILELYTPKGGDERKFVDKHVINTAPDRNGNDDAMFKGGKVKPIDRKKTRHGYDPKKDEEVYEETEQLDEYTHEGVVRAASIARKKGQMKKAQLYLRLAKALETNDETTAQGIARELEGLKEESELEEKLSPSMGAGEYVSDFEKSKAPQFAGKSKEKRRQMAIAAFLTAKKGGMKEDVDQVDELDKSTMRSYVNKAAVDLVRSGNTLGRIQLKNKNNPSLGSTIMAKHIGKRLKGVETATKKLAYEEVDALLLPLFISLDEENRETMLQMIDEGRRDELLVFVNVVGD